MHLCSVRLCDVHTFVCACICVACMHLCDVHTFVCACMREFLNVVCMRLCDVHTFVAMCAFVWVVCIYLGVHLCMCVGSVHACVCVVC